MFIYRYNFVNVCQPIKNKLAAMSISINSIIFCVIGKAVA